MNGEDDAAEGAPIEILSALRGLDACESDSAAIRALESGVTKIKTARCYAL